MERALNARRAFPPGCFAGRVEAALDAGSVRVSRTAYAPGSATARHAHARALLCLALEGGCEDRYARRSHAHARGDLFLCPAGEAHAQDFAVAARFVCVELGAAATEAVDGLGPGPLAPRPAHANAWRLASELERPDDLSPLVLEGLALELAAALAREGRTRRGVPAWVADVDALLRARLERRPTLRELAAAVDRHPATVARAFRRATGRSVGEHLRALRVGEAARLLAHTRLSVAEVARRAGYADQSHLTRAFRVATGRTPAAFRDAVRR